MIYSKKITIWPKEENNCVAINKLCYGQTEEELQEKTMNDLQRLVKKYGIKYYDYEIK